MTEILEQIIASGVVSGEFATGDAKLAARLVNTVFGTRLLFVAGAYQHVQRIGMIRQ